MDDDDLSRTEAEAIESLGDRLPAAVARACRDHLRTRTTDESRSLLLATLAPAERLAFVLHDLCAMPLDQVARVLGRTDTATRQLAGRARRRVQSPERTLDADRTVQSRVVEAFLTASRTGDVEELVWLLHPDSSLRADAAAVTGGAAAEAVGAQSVAEAFAERAGAARPALLDGFAAAVCAQDGRPEVVFGFTVLDGRVAEIEQLADVDVLPTLDLETGSATS